MTYLTSWWYIIYISYGIPMWNIIQMKLLKNFDVCCWVIHYHSIAVLKHMLWGLNVLFPLLHSYPNFPFRTPSYQTSGSRKSQNLDIFVHPFPSISSYFHPFHSMSYCFHFPSMSSYFHFQSISSYFRPFLMHFHPVWPICRSNIPIFQSYFPIFSAPGHTFQDFHGGEFVFEAHGTSSAAAVEPRAGRVVAFSSDAENPHKVGAFEPWGGVSSQKKIQKNVGR